MTQYVQEKVAKIESPVTAWILLSLILMLSCVYAYFVSGTIQNIIAAKEMRSEISSLTSTVGNLEADYLSSKASVTLEYGKTLGLVEATSATVYVAKKPQSALSFNR